MKLIVHCLFCVGAQLIVFTLVNQSPCENESLPDDSSVVILPSGIIALAVGAGYKVRTRQNKNLEAGIIQEREITGNGMPLNHFNSTINQTLYDISAIGVAKFHSGFIAKIDASGILSTSYRAVVLEAYSNAQCFLTFDGVQTVYDVDYEYEDFKQSGSVLTWYKQLQFEMIIQRNHSTKKVTSTIRLYNTGNQNDYVVKVDPNNGYTQLTAREIKRSITFRQPIADSFQLWSETWKSDLAAAVSDYKFPEICYYCP